jgi:transposase
MVYNVAQYKLRKKLQETKDTLPNQINKNIKNPILS